MKHEVQSTTYEEFLSKNLNLNSINLLELTSTFFIGTKEVKKQVKYHHKARK